jgi:hypothetical protein
VSDHEQEQCPPLEDLLLADEGELQPAAKQRQTQEHVQRCGACRARLDEVDSLIAIIAECRRLTESHEPFIRRIHAELRTTDDIIRYITRRRHADRRLTPNLTPWPLNRWLVVAALWLFIAVVVPGLLTERDKADRRLHHPLPPLQTYARPSALRVRYRLGSEVDRARTDLQPLVIDADLTDEVGLTSQPAVTPGALKNVLTLLHFEWRHPLSVIAFQRWRARIHGLDRVISQSSARVVRLRTTTTEGVLREADVTMWTDTHEVVHEMLDLAKLGEHDIVAVLPRLPPPTSSRPSLFAAAPSSSLPSRETLDLAELRARFVLGDTGLDMRGDVQVLRSNRSVSVDGTVPSGVPYRKIAQLTALPHVDVSLRRGGSTRITDFGRSSNGAPALERWAPPTSSADSTRDGFVPILVQLLARVRQRLYLLHGLDKRYSEPEVEALSPDARREFDRLLNLHYRALNGDLQRLNARIEMMISDNNRYAGPLAEAPSDWRSRTAAGLSHVTSLEEQMHDLLTREDATAEQERRVANTFGSLWDSLLR